MGVEIIERIADGIASYFSSNRRLRRLRRIERKARRGYRQFTGYPLNNAECLTDNDLNNILQPDTQTAAEVYTKLVGLHRDEKYTLLLLWCWAAEFGKPCNFSNLPEIG